MRSCSEKSAVASLPLPASGERYVYDTVCPQLAVRLRPGGRVYMLVMWDSTRRRTVKATLGKVEKLTPENARRKAQAMVADVGHGVDVRRPAVEGVTVAELLDKWHAEKARNVRTADELKGKALHYLGKLAHRRAAEVTRQDIGTIHSHIATEARKRIRKRVGDTVQSVETGPVGLPATADKWRAVLHSCLCLGHEQGSGAGQPRRRHRGCLRREGSATHQLSAWRRTAAVLDRPRGRSRCRHARRSAADVAHRPAPRQRAGNAMGSPSTCSTASGRWVRPTPSNARRSPHH